MYTLTDVHMTWTIFYITIKGENEKIFHFINIFWEIEFCNSRYELSTILQILNVFVLTCCANLLLAYQNL